MPGAALILSIETPLCARCGSPRALRSESAWVGLGGSRNSQRKGRPPFPIFCSVADETFGPPLPPRALLDPARELAVGIGGLGAVVLGVIRGGELCRVRAPVLAKQANQWVSASAFASAFGRLVDV